MPRTVRDAFEATQIVYQEVARRKQATIWGEKTPHWYDCPLEMARQFPEARFIFLWRDVSAVISSVTRAGRNDRFFRKKGFVQKILIGNENLRRACDALLVNGRAVHEVNYEDLTENTSKCMRQICRFLEIPFDERMATLQGADRSAIASGSHHLMVRGNAIKSSSVHAEVLSEKVRAKISRYACRWKLLSGGKWPKYPRELPPRTQVPSLLELCRDRLCYKTALARDALVAVTYAIVPINAARSLRIFLRRHDHQTELLPISQQ